MGCNPYEKMHQDLVPTEYKIRSNAGLPRSRFYFGKFHTIKIYAKVSDHEIIKVSKSSYFNFFQTKWK